MKGSEFVQAYAGRKPAEWEAAVVQAVRDGSVVSWPMQPVTITSADHELVIQVASDYLAVGDETDFVRMPLTPGRAQECADLKGCLLPTFELVRVVHSAASVKASPDKLASWPNREKDLSQYAEHNARVEKVLADVGASSDPLLRGIVSGVKKDIVVGNLYKRSAQGIGRVLIYGWFRPDAPLQGRDPAPMLDGSKRPWPAARVQPYSSVHDDGYADYSHGVRLIQKTCTLDGADADLEEIMRDPNLAVLVSGEGALRMTRYPYQGSSPSIAPVVLDAQPSGGRSTADLGAYELVRQSLIKKV